MDEPVDPYPTCVNKSSACVDLLKTALSGHFLLKGGS